METAAPSVFESFNAKDLRPSQVAETFVTSDNFRKLSYRRNTLLIGPRGSGKTTLLKMLQGEALDAWQGKEAKEYRCKIDFKGVFIPTDRVWKEQIDALIDNLEDGVLISTALFTTHVLHHIAKTFEYEIKKIPKCGAIEEFIKELAEVWQLNLDSYSFRSLLAALSIRKSEIPRIANVIKYTDDVTFGDFATKNDYQYLFIDFIQVISSSMELFAQMANGDCYNWALLFDELELAPVCIVEKLIKALRGSNDRLFFKLSMAPFTPDISIVNDIFSAMEGNDHDIIKLWSAKKIHADKEFPRKLLVSMLKERGITGLDPGQVFGRPKLELHETIFRTAWERDPTFVNYLKHKNIDVSNISNLPPELKDSIVRKAAPLLRIRNIARNKQKLGGPAKYASLKALPDYYAGADQLFTILENNPRWFIGVISPLLDEFIATKKKIPTFRQLQEIQSAMEKFIHLLKTIPSPIQQAANMPAGIEFTIDLIGTYFKKNTILSPFKDQPHGSFNVDNKIPKQLRQSLGAALNAGAIVEVEGGSDNDFINDLIGRRFRLSYLLAPTYRQPLILMAAVSLTKILKEERGKYEYDSWDQSNLSF